MLSNKAVIDIVMVALLEALIVLTTNYCNIAKILVG